MALIKKTFVLALLCLASSTAWSEPVHFCKVKRVYENDIDVKTKTAYEDCSGVAFAWHAKDYVKAACWQGAVDLLEGKCEASADDAKESSTENTDTAVEEAAKVE